MEIKFEKTVGSEDFQQELIDILMIKYQTIDFFISDLLNNGKELHVKREKKEGSISFSVSIIDINNEIITINWLGIG